MTIRPSNVSATKSNCQIIKMGYVSTIWTKYCMHITLLFTFNKTKNKKITIHNNHVILIIDRVTIDTPTHSFKL